MWRHRRIWFTAVATMLVFALAGCDLTGGGGGGGGGSKVPAAPRLISTMPASDFHAIGVAAHAPALGAGQTAVADYLHADQARVNSYYQDVCISTDPLSLPSLVAYPNQVPAYEALFAQAQGLCPGATQTALDRRRGRVANSMVHSQQFLDQLNGTSRNGANGFCAQLEKSSQITTTVITSAASKLGATETEAKLVEFGVTLLINNCAELLARVGG